MSVAWTSVDTPPPPGRYLCYCRIPEVKRNGVVTRKERLRYLALEYADGTFWVNRGAPHGFVLFWAELLPPPNQPHPESIVKARPAMAHGRPASAACNSSEGTAA